MAKKKERTKKTRNIIVKLDKFGIEEKTAGFFGVLKNWPMPIKPLKPLPLTKHAEFSLRQLRQLLSDEKARILHVLKAKKPNSIYELAKFLGRDFKAVRQDLKLLEQFGFVKLISERAKNRKRLKPVINLDKMQVTVEI